ncbi:MAG: hypothetical protein KME05_17030 [Gloeocapsa sp. UFS-A4-WI-NPMV-4B04]|jgi:hypothetical protein|nr:hypothetical protein [Gloeocapsa sp. UFS-A4-WI-NPMV-4B04]
MKPKSEKDIRVAATSKIWAFATDMRAASAFYSPCGITRVSIPVAVIIGAAVSTVMVWRSFEHQPKNSPLLTNSIKELEERISNLEIICSDQELDLQRKIKQLKSKN